jgi:hypothetical protein
VELQCLTRVSCKRNVVVIVVVVGGGGGVGFVGVVVVVVVVVVVPFLNGVMTSPVRVVAVCRCCR